MQAHHKFIYLSAPLTMHIQGSNHQLIHFQQEGSQPLFSTIQRLYEDFAIKNITFSYAAGARRREI